MTIISDAFRFTQPGRYEYFCALHPKMTGAIVVGRGGDMIKQIGTAARQEIQHFLDRKVFLDLRVAVREQWRENDRLLDELGVRPPEK